MKRMAWTFLSVLFFLAAPGFADVQCSVTASGCTGGGASGGIAASDNTDFTGDNVFQGKSTFGTAADALDAIWFVPDGTIAFEGASADGFETFLAVTDPTADRTITFPNLTGTVPLLESASNTWTGTQVFNAGSTYPAGQSMAIVSFTNVGSMYGTAANTPYGFMIPLGTLARSLIIVENADKTFNFNNGPCGVGACTDPTFIVHSATQSTTEWAALTHDATNAHLSTGTGGFLGLAYAVEANTGAKTPTLGGESDENGELYTNTGDGDGSSITLPNDPTVGAIFRVAATVAQTITLSPGAGETLYYEGDQCTVSLTSATIGTIVEVVAATGGNGAIWIADGGGWTCNDA